MKHVQRPVRSADAFSREFLRERRRPFGTGQLVERLPGEDGKADWRPGSLVILIARRTVEVVLTDYPVSHRRPFGQPIPRCRTWNSVSRRGRRHGFHDAGEDPARAPGTQRDPGRRSSQPRRRARAGRRTATLRLLSDSEAFTTIYFIVCRLDVVPIHLASLRERFADIVPRQRLLLY
jgi:hypothetical protein